MISPTLKNCRHVKDHLFFCHFAPFWLIENRPVGLHISFYRRLPSLILKHFQTTADLQRLRPKM